MASLVAVLDRGTVPVIVTTSSGLVPQVTIGGSVAGVEPHDLVEMRAFVGSQRVPVAPRRSQSAPLGASAGP